jgi:hypothetical protein
MTQALYAHMIIKEKENTALSEANSVKWQKTKKKNYYGWPIPKEDFFSLLFSLYIFLIFHFCGSNFETYYVACHLFHE